MIESDDHGIVEVFAESLELALKRTRPDLAFEAAQAATRQYLKSFDWLDMSSKGGEPEYRKVRKREGGKNM